MPNAGAVAYSTGITNLANLTVTDETLSVQGGTLTVATSGNV